MTPRIASGAALAAALALLGATPAGAQRIGGGAAYAFADYAEQGASLRFAGSGVGGHASIEWRRLTLRLAATRLSFEPDGGSAEAFDMLQTDARLRLRVSRLASVEAGWLSRDVDPLHAAQSLGALRLGALVAFPIAAGSEVSLRSSWLGASRFSGGGSAPFGVEVGLGMAYAPWSERLRLTGDLEFQRFDRRTSTPSGRLDAPIQSTTARIGVALVR
jgi:hypothetical protein